MFPRAGVPLNSEISSELLRYVQLEYAEPGEVAGCLADTTFPQVSSDSF